MAADYFTSGHFRLSMPMGIDKNVLHKIRLFYYSQNLNIFCSLDPCLNAGHLLRYLGIKCLSWDLWILMLTGEINITDNS